MAVWAAAAIMSLGCARVSNATLIAADSFLVGSPGNPAIGEYDISVANQLRRNTANGAGQNPIIPGFVGPWTGNLEPSTAIAQWTIATPGTTSPTLTYPAGGRARFAGNSASNTVVRRVQRTLAPYTPSNTYYISLLSQASLETGTGEPSGFIGVGFTNTGTTAPNYDANFSDSSTTMRGLLIGVAGNGTTVNYVVRHLGATGIVNDAILLNLTGTDTPTRLTIAKLEFNDDPTNPAGNSKMTIWQDPADLTSESAATAAAAPLVFRTFALANNADITQLTMLGMNYSKPVSFDEPRLGTTWADVAPVPEPAALATLALSGVALLGRRNRRA
jgi:hypothetical protein